jgi:hypothetical protein
MKGAREGVLAGSDEVRLIEAGRWRPAPRSKHPRRSEQIIDVRPTLAAIGSYGPVQEPALPSPVPMKTAESGSIGFAGTIGFVTGCPDLALS